MISAAGNRFRRVVTGDTRFRINANKMAFRVWRRAHDTPRAHGYPAPLMATTRILLPVQHVGHRRAGLRGRHVDRPPRHRSLCRTRGASAPRWPRRRERSPLAGDEQRLRHERADASLGVRFAESSGLSAPGWLRTLSGVSPCAISRRLPWFRSMAEMHAVRRLTSGSPWTVEPPSLRTAGTGAGPRM